MAKSIYVTSAEGHSGKSTIALGLLETLSRSVGRVAVFRSIARSTVASDYVLEMLRQSATVDVPFERCIGATYDDVHADPDGALSLIVERFRALERECDAVVVLGSDYTDVGSPTELAYNARIAANLAAPVLLVLGGRVGQGSGEQLGRSDPRSAADMSHIAELALVELRAAHTRLAAVVVNRADPDGLETIRSAVEPVVADPEVPVWAIPEDTTLTAPSMADLLESVEGELIKGDPALLAREALGVVIAGMSMVNVLDRLSQGAVVVIAADRPEVLLATLMANASATFPSLAGVVLNGGFELPDAIVRLIDGLNPTLPIVATRYGTYDTAVRITSTRAKLTAESPQKRDLAIALYEANIDTSRIVRLLDVSGSGAVTPLMFEYGLIDRARASRRRIVLPEGDDDRILRAANTVLGRGIADITLLGDERGIRDRATKLGLHLDAAQVIDTRDPELRERLAQEYAALRAHRGVTIDNARAVVIDPSYFGTLMVHAGMADGMVSGAAHTTAHTVRPAFEIIKTRSGVSVVSSVFFMALADRVLVYGDCAVIPVPTADQLADIAVSSAETAAQFGIEPRVAMLSYSTGDSGSGADVDKVREATELVHERRPDLLVEGPLQYDAAADADVAAAKMPDSRVAGRATVYVFPDLNTGNNTYKAVQRSSGAVAIGPILQGLNKPINDLSRGALVQDIVNTIAITAIQAQLGAR